MSKNLQILGRHAFAKLGASAYVVLRDLASSLYLSILAKLKSLPSISSHEHRLHQIVLYQFLKFWIMAELYAAEIIHCDRCHGSMLRLVFRF